LISYDYPLGDFLLVTTACLGVVVVLMTLTAVLAKTTGKVSVVDTIWGLGFIVVTLTAVLLGSALRDDNGYGVMGYTTLSLMDTYQDFVDQQDLRSWLVLALVTLWGGRLAWHIGRRARGGAEDPRYVELMAGGNGGLRHLIAKVLLPQGLAIWFVSMPIHLTVVGGDHLTPVLIIGVLVFAVGLAFETIGDAQLAAYKKDPDRGPVMDQGLWRYTRHPNYFGDACVWWGIYLVCASSWPGVFTILSPIAMTFFLVFATGARLLERTMMQRTGYPEYAEKTSMFFPLPPKK